MATVFINGTRYDTDKGGAATTIAGASTTSYTLTPSDTGKYVSFEVTPSDGANTGSAVGSERVGPIIDPANADLINLTLSHGTLSPDFVTGTTAYSASVTNAVSTITATPTVSDASATVAVNGAVVISGQASGDINLNVGVNAITVLVTARDGMTTKTYTVTVTRAPDSSGGGSSGGGSNPTADTNTGVIVLVNGKPENAGSLTTSTQGAQTVTTITVDRQKLEQKLDSEGDNAVVTVPINTDSDIRIGQLPGDLVKKMENMQAVLEVKTDTASYRLPARQIRIDDVSAQLGTGVELKDIILRVEIANPTADMVKVVEDSAAKGNLTIVATAFRV